jgi:small subunit ribosomal protein S13
LVDEAKKEEIEKSDGEIQDSKEIKEKISKESKDLNVEEPEKLVDSPQKEEIKQVESTEEKPPKKEKKKEPEVKKDTKQQDKKKDSDFNYIVRLANTDIDGEKRIIFGLTQIKGLGRRMATYVADAAGIDRRTKCGNLKDAQLKKINQVLENMNERAPSWILNHRKDFDTGEDLHLIGSDIEMKLRDDVNLLKMIRSYRGIRHETGLRCRGQRTRANNRRGLSLGVSKK